MIDAVDITPDDHAMLDRVTAMGPSLVARAVEWANISSGSLNLAGLQAMQAALEGALATLPGELEVIPLMASQSVSAAGSVVAQSHSAALRLTVRPEAAIQIVLTGHYDTVYPHGTSFITITARADGALHGPGIADMKGGISLMLGALAAFEAHPLATRVGYRVLLSPDEEIGSPASAALLAEIAKGAHLGMTYEPSLPDGSLVEARKGSGNYHLIVRGKAAHAGRDFASGRNAVAAAAALAAQLAALNGKRAGVTLNIARIDGGAPLNMVPDLAVLRFNVRMPDADAGAWVVTQIAQLSDQVALDFEVHIERHGGVTRAPKPKNAAQHKLSASVTAVGAALGETIGWKPSGGVCEGNNLFAAGVPNIDTLGVIGGDIHSHNEFAWPDSFTTRAQLSALLLAKIASGAVDARHIHSLMTTH